MYVAACAYANCACQRTACEMCVFVIMPGMRVKCEYVEVTIVESVGCLG